MSLLFLRAPSGALVAGETTGALLVPDFSRGKILLDITTLTLPDADDELDFWIQTTYDGGANWTDIENIHFSNADDGSTAQRVVDINDANDGPGAIEPITGTDPIAGAEIVETVPANVFWKVRAINLTLVTAVAVADRGVLVSLGDGANAYHRTRQHDVQIASLARSYSYSVGTYYLADQLFGEYFNVLPDLRIAAGHVWQTVTGSIQAADDYGAPQYLVEAWHDPRVSGDAAMGDNLKSYDRPLGSQVRIRTAVTGATAPTYAYSASGVFR